MKSINLSIKNLTVLLFLITSFISFAQQEVFVSGQVIDAETKENLEFCSVSFFNAKKELVSGVITNEKGYFEISLMKGKYEMRLDFMSYESQKLPISIHKNNQFLGTYKMKIDENILNEVVVKANTKSFKVDKNVYSVTKKMKIAAANTNDVLDKISGVTLDRYSNSIKVDGEANVKFLVNGLEKDSEYIQNLNPDRLKNIEITRDPSGKYGLEGYTSVINVILKQDYKGMELSLFDQSIIDSDAKNKDHLLPINALSVGFNYTYNKINLYSKYSQNLNNFSFPTQIYKTYIDGTRIDRVALNDTENLKSKEVNDDFVLGVDYYINPRHTVSFESKFSNVLSNENNSTIDYLVNEYYNESLVNSHSETRKSDGNGNGNYQSVFYIAKFNDNDQLNLDATISASNDDSRNDFYENTIFEHTDVSDNKQNKFRFNSEFTHNINEKSSFNLGYGFYHLKSKNNFNASNYTLKDNRHKLFGYYALKPSKKIAVKVGVAGEMSTPELSDKKLNYFIYQPYLDVKYNLSKKVDLKLKYRSNSNYPSLSEANPNIVFIDNETESKGNPNLKPSVTHKISVRSNILNGFLSVEPYYHFSNNYIGQIGKLRSDGIIEYNYDNVGSYRNYGVKGNIAFPFPLLENVYWQTSANYYRSSIVYDGNKNAFNDIHLESNIVYVNRKKGLTAGAIFQRGMNKRISTQGFNKGNNDFLGLLVQKGFYKNKLNLMLLYMLPIEGGLEYIQQDYVSTPTFNRMTEYDINLLKNVFVFKLNYRFSKGKSTRKTAKDIEEDEKKKDGFF